MTREIKISCLAITAVAVIVLWTASRPSDMDRYVEELIREGKDSLQAEYMEKFSRNNRNEELLDARHEYDVAKMNRYGASDAKYDKEQTKYELSKKSYDKKSDEIIKGMCSECKEYEAKVRECYRRFDDKVPRTPREIKAWSNFKKCGCKLSKVSDEDYQVLQDFFIRATHTN